MQPTTKSQDIALLLVRFITAAIFLYAAYAKLSLWSAPPESTGMSVGMLNLMKFLSIAEPIGAAALVLGILTRVASVCLSVIMLGAIYVSQFVHGIGFSLPAGPGWNFPLAVLASCLALAAFGAGYYSLDGMWNRALNRPLNA